jgi:hypothetical protein
MISIKITALVIAALSLTAFIHKDKKSDGKGFAVVELFTSEGCSSCPPADELLARLEKESAGKPVYLMAYHVDYWDRLGWKDAFSSAAFSDRQQQYQSWLNTSTIYTPQVVINGKTEFIGSDETTLRNTIQQQLTGTPAVELKLQLHQNTVEYTASKVTKGDRLLIAIIQKTAQSKVSRGENAGHTLSHVQVVHTLQSEPLKEKGTIVVKVPENYEITGFIQNQRSGEIIAAAKAE